MEDMKGRGQFPSLYYEEVLLIHSEQLLTSGMIDWVTTSARRSTTVEYRVERSQDTGPEKCLVTHLVGGCHPRPGARPEPAVDVLRLEVPAAFAPFEVTQATACPDVRNIVCKTNIATFNY